MILELGLNWINVILNYLTKQDTSSPHKNSTPTERKLLWSITYVLKIKIKICESGSEYGIQVWDDFMILNLDVKLSNYCYPVHAESQQLDTSCYESQYKLGIIWTKTPT